MDLETEILLNQFAQGFKPMSAAEEWFVSHPEPLQQEVLRGLVHLAGQAGAVGRHVQMAIELSGLKSTYTPCVLLTRAANRDEELSRALYEGLAKVLALPSSEASKSFRLLLSLLAVADDERRRHEGGICERHWWHRALDDPAVIADIRRARQ